MVAAITPRSKPKSVPRKADPLKTDLPPFTQRFLARVRELIVGKRWENKDFAQALRDAGHQYDDDTVNKKLRGDRKIYLDDLEAFASVLLPDGDSRKLIPKPPETVEAPAKKK